jgi:hypothetical protein
VTTPRPGRHRGRRHSPAHLSALQPPSLLETAAALRHVTGSPGPGLLRRLRPVPARSADSGPSPHTAPDARLKAGPRRFPRSLADLLTKEEPGYAPAASTATPQHFTVASPAGAERPTRKFPARKKRQRRTAPGPDPPGSSRCPLRRRNRRFLAYSSPSRSPDPPHLTVLTRPGFVRAACHHPRHLPDQAALSFDRLAATRRRRRSLTSTRST